MLHSNFLRTVFGCVTPPNHSRLALAVAGKIFALFRLSLSQWSPENVIFSPLWWCCWEVLLAGREDLFLAASRSVVGLPSHVTPAPDSIYGGSGQFTYTHTKSHKFAQSTDDHPLFICTILALGSARLFRNRLKNPHSLVVADVEKVKTEKHTALTAKHTNTNPPRTVLLTHTAKRAQSVKFLLVFFVVEITVFWE